MESIDESPARKSRPVHWTARILGLILVGFWLFIMVKGAIDGGLALNSENGIMLALILASTMAFIVAWWSERLGGILLLAVGLGHCTFAFFAAGHNKALAVSVSGVPFLLLGALFLWSWSRSRSS